MRISKKDMKFIVEAVDKKVPYLFNMKQLCKAQAPETPDFIKEKSPEYYEGMLQGVYSMIEDFLFAQRPNSNGKSAYRGFNEWKGYREYSLAGLSVAK